MTVRELINFLKALPPDVECVTSRYSDLEDIVPEDIHLRIGVRRQYGIEKVQPHIVPTMCAADQAKVKTYLYFEGN